MAARRLPYSLFRYSLLRSPTKPSLYNLASVTAPPESILKDGRRGKIADEISPQLAIFQHKGTSSLSSQNQCATQPTIGIIQCSINHVRQRHRSRLCPRPPTPRPPTPGKKRYAIYLRGQRFSDQHQAVQYHHEFLLPFLKSNENLEDLRVSSLPAEVFNGFHANLDDDVAAEFERHPDVSRIILAGRNLNIVLMER